MSNLLRRGLALLRAPAHALGYEWRARHAVSRGGAERIARSRDADPRASCGSADGLFDHVEDLRRRAGLIAREAELRQVYGLRVPIARDPRRDYRDSLDVLDLLDRRRGLFDSAGAFAALGDRPLRALDVGAHSWSYVGGLLAFVTRLARELGRAGVELTGVEVDGAAAGRAGCTRADWARVRAQEARDVQLASVGEPFDCEVGYEVADVRSVAGAGQFELVTLFMPFLTWYPALDWGLAPQLFAPSAVLDAVARHLAVGGRLVSSHQTAAEATRMRQLVTRGRLPLRCLDDRLDASQLVAHWRARADRRVLLFERLGGDESTAMDP